MGVEVFLIRIKIIEKLSYDRLDYLFDKLGFRRIKDETLGRAYELLSEKGIIESLAGGKRKYVNTITLRFSYVNPDAIIDQAITVLTGLHKKVRSKIYIEEKILRFNQETLSRLRKDMFDNKKRFEKKFRVKKNTPIRGGDETFLYLDNYKKEVIGTVELLENLPDLRMGKGEDPLHYPFGKGSTGTLVRHGDPPRIVVEFRVGPQRWRIPLKYVKGHAKITKKIFTK